MFKSHFSQQSTPIHGFLTPFQPQTEHTSPLRLVYFMICHNVSWRIMIFSWYCISWYIMIPYPTAPNTSETVFEVVFWGVNIPELRVFGALIIFFHEISWLQKPLQSSHSTCNPQPWDTIPVPKKHGGAALSVPLVQRWRCCWRWQSLLGNGDVKIWFIVI